MAWWSSTLVRAPNTNGAGAISLGEKVAFGFTACAQDGTQSANGIARVTFGKSVTSFGVPGNTCVGYEFRFTGSGKKADVYMFFYNGGLTYTSVLDTVDLSKYHDFVVRGIGGGWVQSSIDGGNVVQVAGLSYDTIGSYFTLEITNGADAVDNRLLITAPVVAF